MAQRTPCFPSVTKTFGMKLVTNEHIWTQPSSMTSRDVPIFPSADWIGTDSSLLTVWEKINKYSYSSYSMHVDNRSSEVQIWVIQILYFQSSLRIPILTDRTFWWMNLSNQFRHIGSCFINICPIFRHTDYPIYFRLTNLEQIFQYISNWHLQFVRHTDFQIYRHKPMIPLYRTIGVSRYSDVPASTQLLPFVSDICRHTCFA